jgi:hypothetical protein
MLMLFCNNVSAKKNSEFTARKGINLSHLFVNYVGGVSLAE